VFRSYSQVTEQQASTETDAFVSGVTVVWSKGEEYYQQQQQQEKEMQEEDCGV
jgi:membrane-bound inhibitor of C-type lysozyme